MKTEPLNLPSRTAMASVISCKNTTVLLIGGYILLFLALRLINIGEFPINSDEIRHILRAQTTLQGDLFIGLRESLKQFYIWLLAGVIIFIPDHLLAGRGLTVLCGLGNGALCYLLGLRLFHSRLIGLTAALLYMFSPYALFYDRLALTDSLLTLCGGGIILLSHALWQRGSYPWAVLLGVLCGVAALTKIYGAIFYVTPLLFWWPRRHDVAPRQALKLLLITFAVAALAWLPILRYGQPAYREDHIKKLMSTQEEAAPLSMRLATNWQWLTDWLTAYLTWPFIIMLLLTMALSLYYRQRIPLILMALASLFIAVIVLLLDTWAPRYLLPIILPLSLLAAWGSVALFSPGHARGETEASLPKRTRLLHGGLLLLLCLPWIHFDYLIIAAPQQAPLPAFDRRAYLGGHLLPAAAYRESGQYLGRLAVQHGPLTVLRGPARLNFYHQTTALPSFFVPPAQRAQINFVEEAAFDSQIPRAIFDRYARQQPTFIVTTSRIESPEIVAYNHIQLRAAAYPRLWKRASFAQPDGGWKVEIYQWLLQPDFARYWLAQGGDPAPQLLWQLPAEVEINPAALTGPGQLHPLSAGESMGDYLLLTPEVVQNQPDFWPGLMIRPQANGQRLHFNQLPADWWLGYAHPDLSCQWCLWIGRPPMHPLTAPFGEAITLTGYDLAPAAISPTHPLHVTLYWHGEQPPHRNYQIFVHLLNQEGVLVAQHDGQPLGGKWPTAHWPAGARLADRHTLTVAAPLPPGEYTLTVGLYDTLTLERLPTTATADALPLTTLTLP